MSFEEVVVIYKKYVEPFIAILVVIGLCYSCVMLYQNYQAKLEISRECGWADEDFRCYCEKSEVIRWENSIKDEFGGLNFNVSLDG